jgi:hypothetical protein
MSTYYVTVTSREDGGVIQYVIAWQADANGSVDVAMDGREYPKVRGILDRLVTIPSKQFVPDDNYHIRLYGENDLDFLQNRGLNRDTANLETAFIWTQISTNHYGDVVARGYLRFVVANAGASAAGLAILYVVQY